MNAVTFFTHPVNALLLLTALASGLLLAWPTLRRGGARGLSTLEATQLMNRKNAQVLDLRAAARFAEGHILNARNVSAKAVQDGSADLPKNKSVPLLLVCDAGQRSAACVRALKEQGYEAAHALAGGHAAWVAAGLPVSKSAGQ
ncbi:MAG: rhodanese-like domain-containing protein [Burkholderiaceae bacterium]|nr:MAG: rhodanese-like domain-containing protein [Burkholderiaceae bacterium]